MKFLLSEDKSKLILQESTKEEYNQLKLHFKRYVNNYRFMQRYKLHVWDGTVDFFNNGYINFGQWHEIYELCQNYGYKFDIINKETFPKDNSITVDKVQNFCNDFYKGYTLPDGKPFIPHEHQVNSVYKLLKFKYGLIEVATAGGKSLAFASMIFYILKHINPDAKFLLIVPNISLVTQFYDDIIDYNIGYHKEQTNPLKIKIMEVMSDKPRKVRDGENPNIYIGTYQSLEKYPDDFFKQFTVVATDEAHKCKSQTLKTILTRTFGFAQYRIGMSGTYPKNDSCEFFYPRFNWSNSFNS